MSSFSVFTTPVAFFSVLFNSRRGHSALSNFKFFFISSSKPAGFFYFISNNTSSEPSSPCTGMTRRSQENYSRSTSLLFFPYFENGSILLLVTVWSSWTCSCHERTSSSCWLVKKAGLYWYDALVTNLLLLHANKMLTTKSRGLASTLLFSTEHTSSSCSLAPRRLAWLWPSFFLV